VLECTKDFNDHWPSVPDLRLHFDYIVIYTKP